MSTYATVKYAEPGTDATQDTSLYDTLDLATGASLTSDTVLAHTGKRSLKCISGSSQGDAMVKINSVLADAGSRVSYWLYITDYPAGADCYMFFAQNAGATANCFAVRFGTNGVIVVVDSNGLIVGTNTSTVLPKSQWIRISISFILTSITVNDIKVWVNGQQVCTCHNVTLQNVGSSKAIVGWGGGVGGNGKQINIDDIYVDSGTDLTDPGDMRVTAKRPFSNGNATNFGTQIGVSGSSYGTGHAQQVNEQPLSTTNGWQTTINNTTEEYFVEPKEVGDQDLTGVQIIDWMGWIYANAGGSENATIIVNGVSTTIALTTTNTLYRTMANSSVYPTGGNAVGMISGASTTTESLYEAGIIVAYKANANLLPNKSLRPAAFKPGLAR